MKFNKKYKVLPLGMNNSMHQYMLGAPAGKQPGKQGPGGPGGHQVEMRQQSALPAKKVTCFVLQKVLPASQGRRSFPSTQHW